MSKNNMKQRTKIQQLNAIGVQNLRIWDNSTTCQGGDPNTLFLITVIMPLIHELILHFKNMEQVMARKTRWFFGKMP